MITINQRLVIDNFMRLTLVNKLELRFEFLPRPRENDLEEEEDDVDISGEAWFDPFFSFVRVGRINETTDAPIAK